MNALKDNPEIKNIYIFSWYDFPMYSELHNSGVKFEHETCEAMYQMFKGYDNIMEKEEEEAEQTWIDAVVA